MTIEELVVADTVDTGLVLQSILGVQICEYKAHKRSIPTLQFKEQFVKVYLNLIAKISYKL